MTFDWVNAFKQYMTNGPHHISEEAKDALRDLHGRLSRIERHFEKHGLFEDDYPVGTKDPADPDEVLHCPKCETEIKIKDTRRERIGNELHMTWKCSGCNLPRSAVIILGPLHSIMAGGQGGAAHPDPDPDSPPKEK